MSPALDFDVIGAAGPKRLFSGMARGDMAHAYLFSGPEGVGKKTFARRLAQSLLCQAPHESVIGYDGTCASCRLFEAGDNTRHPDFIENAGLIKIGDRDNAGGFYEEEELTSRDLVRQFAMQSYLGGLRVVLMGDAELTREAANALLNFLEEPPEGVVAIFTSAMPGRLLPTVRSRLVDVRFPALSAEDVGEILKRHGYDAERAALGARLGAGSATRAMSALDDNATSLRGQVATWFFAAASGEVPEIAWATRETLAEGMEIVKGMARDWIALSLAGEDAPLSAPDYVERLRSLGTIGPVPAAAMLARLDDAQRISHSNASPAMVGDVVRMAISRIA